ncbi:hypothetical protein HY385_02530 [Candidatus Daviesbacteria bacterium]|nr:hypothetical protein [Candidatus Daviesbacteria bacterium]
MPETDHYLWGRVIIVRESLAERQARINILGDAASRLAFHSSDHTIGSEFARINRAICHLMTSPREIYFSSGRILVKILDRQIK